VPLVALSPCVSVVPSAHGFVTGEASGLGRTAIPYRRLSSCSTRAWTVFVGCMLPAAQRRLWLRRRTPLPQDSAATRRPHPLFHRRCSRLSRGSPISGPICIPIIIRATPLSRQPCPCPIDPIALMYPRKSDVRDHAAPSYCASSSIESVFSHERAHLCTP
jgi:hypothetical protein